MTHFGRVSRRVVVVSGVLLAGVFLVGLVPWRLVAGEPNALPSTTADNSEHHVAPDPNGSNSLGDGSRLKSHEDESLDHVLRQMWLRASKQRSESKPLPNPIIPPRGVEKDRLMEAESQDGEAQLRLAALKVSERQKDKPETVLSQPTLVFLIGQRNYAVIVGALGGNKIRYLGIMVRSLPNKKPIEHVVEVEMIEVSESQDPVVLAAQSMTVADRKKGSILVTEADGSILRVDATVSPVKIAGTTKLRR